jgi:nucleoid-associated protein YgaU
MKNSILAVLIALCAALAVATLRAAAQSVMTGPRTPPGLATAAPAAQAPAAPAPVTTAPATPAGAIQDATVAPDKRQSADNNVSFPVDI